MAVHVPEYGEDEELELGVFETNATIQRPIQRNPVGSFIAIALGFSGLQLVFAMVFSHGSAFLNNLHFSKPIIALIWLSGPLCGATLQPYLGICSDQHRSRFGKRRPFIVCGAILIILALLTLAWCEDIGPAVASSLAFNSAESQRWALTLTAIFSVFALNVGIQPLQCGLRALIVDICPEGQHDTASAWVGRFVSAANILSYLTGYIDLAQWVPNLGGTQFRILCVITSLTLSITVGLLCFTVRESIPDVHDETAYPSQETVSQKLWYLCTSFPRLPDQVRRVCWVQLFAWMGWFPYLYYIAMYIGVVYQEGYSSSSTRANTSLEALNDEAVRMGSFGLLIFAIVSLLGGAIFPIVLRYCDGNTERYTKERRTGVLAGARVLWMLSHVLFASCMWLTLAFPSLWGTYTLVGLSGLSWSVTIWIPFAVVGTAINADTCRARPHEIHGIEKRPGIVLSLHNVAIAAPQVAAAAGSSLILWALDGGEGEWSASSIGWTLRLATLSTLVAAVLVVKV
ncbi:hypothetical protein F4777DRAFT_584778 [Nemania sp. FL0916]|nr:hypothetical protein F4777DRAFT_584778 [Nemania sp. FL0916]